MLYLSSDQDNNTRRRNGHVHNYNEVENFNNAPLRALLWQRQRGNYPIELVSIVDCSIEDGVAHTKSMCLGCVSRSARLIYVGRFTEVAIGSVSLGSLILSDSKAVNTEESGDAVDDQNCPVHVDNQCEEEVHPEIEKFQPRGDCREANHGQVDEDRATNEGSLHNSPEGEGLSQEMGQNDHGCHASEDECDDPAEQNKVVAGKDSRIRRKQPSNVRDSEDDHRHPLLKQRGEWQALLLAGLSYIQDTSWEMSEEEATDENHDPEVFDGVVAEDLGEVKEPNNGLRPHSRAPDSGGNHSCTGDDQALSRAIEVAEVECVGVERLPCGEVHSQARHECSPSTKLRGSEAHCRRRKQTGQSAVQGVDAVTVPN